MEYIWHRIGKVDFFFKFEDESKEGMDSCRNGMKFTL